MPKSDMYMRRKHLHIDIMQNMDWYASLIKPPLTPPDQVFMIVWPVLYAMIGISFLIFLKTKETQKKSAGIFAFVVQAGLNLLWAPFFFRFKIPQSFFGSVMPAVVFFSADDSDFLQRIKNGILFIASLWDMDPFRFIPEYRYCCLELKKAGKSPPRFSLHF